MRTSVPVFSALLAVSSAGPAAGANSETTNTVRVGRATPAIEAPAIDGRLDEDVWAAAEPLTDFVQAEPFEGQPATERTEVRILFDDEAIYVGAMLYDSDPAGIIATDARRDSGLDDTDSFRVVFDTYHDLQNGFVFGTTPAGLEYDGQLSNAGGGGGGGGGGPQMRARTGSGGGFNVNWDASWTVATAVTDEGWAAEFAIPLRTLRYGNSPQTWGINFHRNIRRKREEDYWSPVARIYNLYRLSSAGELHGLELESPRNLKVTPYALAAAGRDFAAEVETQTNGDFGLDAKVGITPSLNLDLTVNTDFAQVEVDDQQINLTRFNLFFPEKRPFFLENAGNFSMGRGSSVDLFFSRRIGIGPGGVPVPILGGARLSGKAGDYNLGFLNMQTQEVAGVVAANNFSVMSLSREFGERSSLGGMFVNRIATGAPSEDDWNRTWGVDGRLGIGETLTFTGFAARTETPGYELLDGGEYAYSARGEYFRRDLRLWWGVTEVAANFNPEAGFLRRSSYRSYDYGWFGYYRPSALPIFRELRPHITYSGFSTLDGFLETSRLHVDNHFDFENGWYLSPAMNRITEGLEEPFEIREGIVVPTGTYEHWQLGWRWNTDTSDPISYSGALDYGGFLSGDQRSVDTTINYRWGTRLITSAAWLHNDIQLAEGSFVANLGQLRAAFNFTPLIYLQALLQYNDDADVWSSNVRFSWLNTAGTGLFVVYNDTEGLGNVLIGPQNRSLTIKYTHQFDIHR